MMPKYIEDQSDKTLESMLSMHLNSLEMTRWPPIVQHQIEEQVVAIQNEQIRRANIRRTDAEAAAQGLTIECVNITFVDEE